MTNLSSLLSVEDIIDPQEVKLNRYGLITKHLHSDQLKRVDFA